MDVLPFLPIALEMFKPGGAMVVRGLRLSLLLVLLVLKVLSLMIEGLKPRVSVVVRSVRLALQFFRFAVLEILPLMVEVFEPGVSVAVLGGSSGLFLLLPVELGDQLAHAFKPAIAVSVH